MQIFYDGMITKFASQRFAVSMKISTDLRLWHMKQYTARICVMFIDLGALCILMMGCKNLYGSPHLKYRLHNETPKVWLLTPDWTSKTFKQDRTGINVASAKMSHRYLHSSTVPVYHNMHTRPSR